MSIEQDPETTELQTQDLLATLEENPMDHAEAGSRAEPSDIHDADDSTKDSKDKKHSPAIENTATPPEQSTGKGKKRRKNSRLSRSKGASISEKSKKTEEVVEPQPSILDKTSDDETSLAPQEQDVPDDVTVPNEEPDAGRLTTIEEDQARYAALMNVTRKVQGELPSLEELTQDNFEQILEKFRETFEEALDISKKHAQAYIAQASIIEQALTALGEYNRKALEQLSKLTMAELEKIDDPNFVQGKERIKLSETLLERAKMLVDTAEKQVEYSKHIGSVAKPLTSWRLDANKAVWEANKALKLAESKCLELKDKATIQSEPVTAVASKVMSEQSADGITVENVVQSMPRLKIEPAAKSTSFNTMLHDSTRSVISESDNNELASPKIVEDETIAPSTQRPPIKQWPKHVYKDADGEVICYIRAPIDCLPKKRYITCTFGDPLAPWPTIAGHNEVIGRYVSICPNAKCNILPDEPWIIGIPHTYCKVATKETVLYMIASGPKGVPALDDDPKKVHPTELRFWKPLKTMDIVSDEKHFLEARLPKLTEVTFVPVARLRQETMEIGQQGGQFVCMCDPRITLTVPPGALKALIPISIQAQQFDRHQLPTLIEQNEMIMGEVVACSPLIYLTCPKKNPFKPISISLPIADLIAPMTPLIAMDSLYSREADRSTDGASEDSPSVVGAKPSNIIRYDDFQKSLMLPQLLAGVRADAGELVLMRKSEDLEGKWKLIDNERKLQVKDDVVTTELDAIFNCRLLCMKLRRMVQEELLSQCASLLEKSLSEHMVYFNLLQHNKIPESLCLVVAVKDQMEATIEQLSEDGFTKSDGSFGPIFLSDNQQLDLEFKSNIRLTRTSVTKAAGWSGGAVQMRFTSAIVNKYKFTVEVVDKNSQLGLDQYRGLLEISCMRNVVVPVDPNLRMSMRLSLIGAKARRARFKVVPERNHLAHMVIKLPKTQMPEPEKRKLIPFDFQPTDAITPRYLKVLSRKLYGDTWRRLGAALDMSKSRLLAISGKEAVSEEGPAYAMLVSWIKTLPLEADRLGILQRALLNIGRQDLVEELSDFSNEYYGNEDTA